ncbi:toxin-activating lysine-acyltransferase [Roseibium aggregatum]|uniref:RTX toxin-activating lysine-acyltransferase n=1 Tax=Roseibium aggregatum TaxID=187304 RepID=A0A926S5N5_9HYPH|nr:toxin-activating lysine-acyltransferase [Roseibium aggregatum]MBD1546355.1 toxin-activating lysine-acyltransferase [Roseibium aggregatum]
MTEQVEAASSATSAEAATGSSGMVRPREAMEPSGEGKSSPGSSGKTGNNVQIAQAVKNLNAGFGEVVGLLMRDPKCRHLSLADLEWLVLPALAANQMMSARGKVKDKAGNEAGLTVPLALVLWAKVSEEVDQKLEAQKKAGAPLRLAPGDWTSGDIPWLVLSLGPKELQAKLQEKLDEETGAGIKVFAASKESEA